MTLITVGFVSVIPNRSVVVRAPGKLNLYLKVGDLREDGYHELSTVFQSVSLADEVTIAEHHELHVRLRGGGAVGVPTDRRNLAWQAAELLAEHVGRDPNVDIAILKSIPVAGGMAGGSTDAAAVLVGLAALWGEELEREELLELAAELGSDVPFCVFGGTAIGTGRGELLTSALARATLHWVLAFSGEGLSTPAVYRELDRLRAAGTQPKATDCDELLRALVSGDVSQVAGLLHNDLQPAALSLRPDLRRTLLAGREAGALAGIIAGSGPTCMFLAEDAHHAVDIAAQLAGAGVCQSVRAAHGPARGARVV
ncbi:4-(cytidine 5'-diphospho)-2-C-methyl-D-erythritol kinase [Segniliparus rugosus]|uniref:4-diphosphocytidyl-2-C-methyl-D-erythritol kinase n=1 Tax=Segniliparus rugosus (strain ATCC BAA-974 / DSM 45345 / CCUG 50838 / CIP 108380 / JCM 13579 / CDC 945) TaxID=679197 RepID=E5XLZ9_SEGRC|nr:4-(cytidine 5'-diphospho)-2-C-methyl-D-erythritol kinase [Segniliparus rugosus]EFV14605.1 4-(cytidine 5'-diphospho)-2-C-methyl-D-erythritol kinase [Segniliparus rugosus ATCC BAA-974]